MDGQSLTLVRGVMGAGKSDFALWLIHGKDSTVILSADHHIPEKFEVKDLKDAYQKCLEETEAYLERGYSVIVTNVFEKSKDIAPYTQLAKDFGIKLYSVIVEHRHDGTTTKNVSEDKLKRSANRFEMKLTNVRS